VTDKLNVLQPRRDALVAGCRETIEVHAHIAVVAAAALHRIQDRLYMAVNNLRCVLARCVEEEVTGIVLIVRAVDVAVVHRQLKIRRDLAAPLLLLGGLLRRLDRLLDLGEGRLIVLGDQQRNGILLVTAVDAACFPDVSEADAARHDDLRCGCVVIGCHDIPP